MLDNLIQLDKPKMELTKLERQEEPVNEPVYYWSIGDLDIFLRVYIGTAPQASALEGTHRRISKEEYISLRESGVPTQAEWEGR